MGAFSDLIQSLLGALPQGKAMGGEAVDLGVAGATKRAIETLGPVMGEVPVEDFSEMITMNGTARAVYAGSGDLVLQKSPGPHRDGTKKWLSVPAGTALSVTVAAELGSRGASFDANKDMRYDLSEDGGRTSCDVWAFTPVDGGTAPVLISARVLNSAASEIELVFVSAVAARSTLGLSLTYTSGTPRTIATVTGNGTNTLTLHLSSAISYGDVLSFVVNVSNEIYDLAGNVLGALSLPVTNQVFAPTNLTNLEYFYAQTATVSGGLVDAWLDQSGGNHSALGTTTTRPAWDVATEPTIPRPDWDGTDDFLQASVSAAGGSSCFQMVVINPTSATSRSVIDTSDSSTATRRGPMLFFESNSTLRAAADATSGNDAQYTPVLIAGRLCTVAARYTPGQREIYENGVSKNLNTNPVTVVATDRVRFGKLCLAGDVYPYDGPIKMALRYGRDVTAAERQALTAWSFRTYAVAADPYLVDMIASSLDLVAGTASNLYFQSLINNLNPTEYAFSTTGPGTSDATHWTWTPGAGDAGTTQALIITARYAGVIVAQREVSLRVKAAASSSTKKLLAIGDSLTADTRFLNQVQTRSVAAGASITFLGTVTSGFSNPGVACEGYSGYTWGSFRTQGPFVFDDGDGFHLNVPEYMALHTGGLPADLVLWELGINDMSQAAVAGTPVDTAVDTLFSNWRALVGAFRAAMPLAKHAFTLCTPPNPSAGTWASPTQVAYLAYRFRLVQRQIEFLQNREDEGLYLVGSSASIDPASNMFDNVHPTAAGYVQLGDTVWGWLRSML